MTILLTDTFGDVWVEHPLNAMWRKLISELERHWQWLYVLRSIGCLDRRMRDRDLSNLPLSEADYCA